MVSARLYSFANLKTVAHCVFTKWWWTVWSDGMGFESSRSGLVNVLHRFLLQSTQLPLTVFNIGKWETQTSTTQRTPYLYGTKQLFGYEVIQCLSISNPTSKFTKSAQSNIFFFFKVHMKICTIFEFSALYTILSVSINRNHCRPQ